MLFKPESKVQKDRTVMRYTDSRMAKYSRRGLIINFIAYLLCLSLGNMHIIAPTASVILTTGLIVTHLIRGYILFRFEALYSRGPARWRQFFFFATLMGAVWWSIILVSLTLIQGMTNETPILWLYTVIFFSTTIQVTAPFRKFSHVYQVIALFPPAVAAFYTGGFDGYMYALMMCVFIVTLYHQAELLSSSHWQKLEANHELRQKARALEMEKRKVDASVELNTQFLKSLSQEMTKTCEGIAPLTTLADFDALNTEQQGQFDQAEADLKKQKRLLRNIDTFSNINNHEVDIEVRSFPLRESLKRWMEEFKEDSEAHHIELDYRIHPECPDHARGDSRFIARIFANLLGNAIKYSDEGEIFVDFDYRSGSDDLDYLEITIIDRGHKTSIEGSLTIESIIKGSRLSGLWFPICKSLAENMGGSIEMDHDQEEVQYRFRVPLAPIEEVPASA